jgi:hypothetical protein
LHYPIKSFGILLFYRRFAMPESTPAGNRMYLKSWSLDGLGRIAPMTVGRKSSGFVDKPATCFWPGAYAHFRLYTYREAKEA